MAHHLVLGAGGIGTLTATRLVELGHTVTLASRSGRRPPPPGVSTVALDASDSARLAELARGAASIVNAINPPSYTTWDRDWPPVAAAVLRAAEASGAGLVTVSNLYAYGLVDGPMAEGLPLRPNGHKGRLRAQMWRDALELHEAGRIRATELRASDYFGPQAQPGMSVLNDFVIGRAARDRMAFVPMGRADVPHTWTYLPDIGALAATLATDDRAWGRAWHVPSNAARTMDEVVADVARLQGTRVRRVRVLPRVLGTALGVAVPIMRELRETRHQFARPFVLDSSEAERTFGLRPTPWDDALEATIAAL